MTTMGRTSIKCKCGGGMVTVEPDLPIERNLAYSMKIKNLLVYQCHHCFRRLLTIETKEGNS